MRVMVLALVLANALFFMWSTWVAEPPVDVSPREAGGGVELTLLSELDNAPMGGESGADVALAMVEAPDGASEPSAPADAGSAALEPMLDVLPGEAPDNSGEAPVEVAAEGGSDAAVTAATDSGEELSSEPQSLAQAAVPDEAAAPVEAVADDPPPAAEEPLQVAAVGSEVPDPAEAIELAMADTPEQCASMGPFPDLRQATQAASQLRANGFEPSQRLAEEQVWVGHWVYLPSYPTRTEAIEVVERLRELGVKDIYIEPRGDRENAVSLGLFSDRENAELYAGRVRQHDVRPQITDRYRIGSAYWVDIALTAAEAPDPAAYQRDEARRLRLESRACDAPRVAERDAGN